MTAKWAEEATVIVIDDEESMREGCRQALEDAGYSAYAVGDGERGVCLVREMKPDVVLVDLMMPEMDGMAVLAEIQHIVPAPVPVVITGYATIDSSVKAMQMGAYDYVCKPFDDRLLLVTVRRAFEKSRLRRRLAAMEQEKEAALDSFAAVLSSQLRAPVKDALESLRKVTGPFSRRLTAQQTWALEQVDEHLNTLARRIEDWLKLARLQAGVAESERDRVDLASIINDAWRAVPAQQGKGRIEFHVNAQNTISSLTGNAELLREMFEHLFGNCLQFTSGPARISTDVTADGPDTVVRITDSGVAIPEEDLTRLFEPFYAGVRSGMRRKEGCGMGLAIAKKIVSAHGGTITAASDSAGGTTFTLRLPADVEKRN